MFGAKRKARKIRVSEGNEDRDEPEPSNNKDGKSHTQSPRNVIVKPVIFC
jgi:hypothetical protein